MKPFTLRRLQRTTAQKTLQIEIPTQLASNVRRPVPAKRNALVIALQRKYQRQLIEITLDSAFADGEAHVTQAPDQFGAGNARGTAGQLA